MFENRYQKPERSAWQGRTDSNTNFNAFRWHQWIRPLDLILPGENVSPEFLSIAFLGFCCDEGVRRNKGRTGAAKGPQSIRSELANLPCWFQESVRLYDAGNVLCEDGNLEESQIALAEAVTKILDLGYFPIVLGGGHETAYGNYNGIRNHLLKTENHDLGIINFDAHFDLRPYPDGGSSGTMFRQIADDRKAADEEYAYMCIGVQRYGNTYDLFQVAESLGVRTLLSKDLSDSMNWGAFDDLEDYMKPQKNLYVTICSDVFSSAFAPGVSASQPVGLDPELCLKILRQIFRTEKVRGFDISEVSPRFDFDSTTANLAKVLIFSVVNTLATLRGFSK